MPEAISLGVGEPDFETPWQIRRAGIQSLEKGQTFYTSNWGLAELRRRIAALTRRKYQLCYNADKEILVTVGGSEAIDNAIRALVNPGDEVLIPEPSFVCYTPLTQMAGGTPPPADPVEDEFKLTPERCASAITPRTKLLILPYPNNPTGAIMTRDELEAIAAVLRETNIVVHVGRRSTAQPDLRRRPARLLCRAGRDARAHHCGGRLLQVLRDDRLASRLGQGPKELMRHICKVHQFGIMSAPTTAQFAGIEAIRPARTISSACAHSTTSAAAICSASSARWG